MTGKELTIRGLKARGFVLDVNARTSKYQVFSKPAEERIYLVGSAGGLRMNRGRLSVAQSVSLTGTKAHLAYQQLGDPAFRFESVDQADGTYRSIYESLSRPKPAAVPA